MLLSLVVAAGLAAGTVAPAPPPAAQVSLSIQIGAAPVCPYGYFPYAPYNCAPWGYYGPTWFPNGIFIGAGPWFRGGPRFYGWVDRRYDPRFGYRGPMPRRGERGDWDRDHWRGHEWGQFHGSEMRDGHGGEYHGNRGRSDYGHSHGNHGNGHGDHGNPHGDHGHGDHGNGHGDHGHGH